MHITGIGVNGDGERLSGNLSQLEEDLAFFRRCGFDGVELSAHGLDVIINGRVRRPQVERVRAIIERFDFLYTVHAPDWLNLAFPQLGPDGTSELNLEKDVFAACLDFCADIGARLMVYHSGLIALLGVASGLDPSLPDDDALERACEQEVSALRELMPLAAERGVRVGMENRDPHPWEIAALKRVGIPPRQLPKYHAGMIISDLVRQVEGVAHPSLGLTLDFAHLFLAANYCSFDYLEAVRQAAPYVYHLHASDNFGRLGGVFSGHAQRISHGNGDLHLPPGWGLIPHSQALASLPAYHGLYILELHPRFYGWSLESLETVRSLLREAAQVSQLAVN